MWELYYKLSNTKRRKYKKLVGQNHVFIKTVSSHFVRTTKKRCLPKSMYPPQGFPDLRAGAEREEKKEKRSLSNGPERRES